MTRNSDMEKSAELTGESERPIFIGGLMKSGTTLLRALLGQHPRLYASFETHWFEEAIRDGWQHPDSKRMGLLLSLLNINEREYSEICEEKRRRPNREFIDVVMQFCTEREGKARWVEKTPDNIRYWSLIREIWKEPTLIHVTREYKDIYASWKVRRGDSLETFLAAAKRAYDDIRPLMGRESPGYFEIDYLDLVRNTEDTMRRVLKILGEEWTASCATLDVEHGRQERTKFKELMGRESWTFVSLSKPIFEDSIGQWREHVSSDEAARIESELAELYDVFGHNWQSNA